MGTNLCMPTPLPLESHLLQFSLALSSLHSSLPGLLEVLWICQSLTHLRYYRSYSFCLQPSTLDFYPFMVASPSPLHLFSHANLSVTSFLAALFFKKNPFMYLFFYFWLHHAACGILIPRPGTEPMPPAVEVRSLNHWTTREVPWLPCFHLQAAPLVPARPIPGPCFILFSMSFGPIWHIV